MYACVCVYVLGAGRRNFIDGAARWLCGKNCVFRCLLCLAACVAHFFCAVSGDFVVVTYVLGFIRLCVVAAVAVVAAVLVILRGVEHLETRYRCNVPRRSCLALYVMIARFLLSFFCLWVLR